MFWFVLEKYNKPSKERKIPRNKCNHCDNEDDEEITIEI